MHPQYPMSETAGARWMLIGANGTTEVFPSDGKGGVTTIAADSIVSDSELTILEGFTLQTFAAGEDLVITDGAGVTIQQFTTPGTTFAGSFIPFGEDGIQLDGGDASFGASLDTGTTARFILFFRVCKRTNVVTGAKGGG